MVNSKIKHKLTGVTLVELMITVAIIAVLIYVGPGLLKDITRFSRLNTARLETVRDARDSLALINKTLRQATAASVEVYQESGQPPYSAISFSTADGRSLRYYQENTSLIFAEGVSSRTVTTNLRHLAFAYPRTDDTDIISVSVTLEKDTYEGQSKALQMAIEKVRIMN